MGLRLCNLPDTVTASRKARADGRKRRVLQIWSSKGREEVRFDKVEVSSQRQLPSDIPPITAGTAGAD